MMMINENNEQEEVKQEEQVEYNKEQELNEKAERPKERPNLAFSTRGNSFVLFLFLCVAASVDFWHLSER